MLAQVVETEELVRVAMLLVVVDQHGIGRRSDDRIEGPTDIKLACVAVQSLGGSAAAQPRELLGPRQRVERVPPEEVAGAIDRTALPAAGACGTSTPRAVDDEGNRGRSAS